MKNCEILLEKLIFILQMSIDGNGDKGAISCVKPKIITVYREYLHSTQRNSKHP